MIVIDFVHTCLVPLWKRVAVWPYTVDMIIVNAEILNGQGRIQHMSFDQKLISFSKMIVYAENLDSQGKTQSELFHQTSICFNIEMIIKTEIHRVSKVYAPWCPLLTVCLRQKI